MTAVLPYAVIGLALGSVFKRPGTGAALGTLVGMTRGRKSTEMVHPSSTAGLGKWYDWMVIGKGEGRKLEAWEMGKHSRTYNLSVRLRQGTYERTRYRGAPSKASSVKQAKIAAGWAYKNGRPAADNKGWTPAQIGLEWSGAPWAKKRTINSVLDAAAKSGITASARAYLIGVRGRSAGTKVGAGVYTPWKKPKAVAQAKKAREKRRRRGVAVQGPREDTYRFVSASPGIEDEKKVEWWEEAEWWKTKQAKVGAGVGIGVLVLVVILSMGGRR